MDWRYFRCSWCQSATRVVSDMRLATCPQCGGEVTEIDEPRDALWACDTLISREELRPKPGTPMRPRPIGIAGSVHGPLKTMARDVLVRGTPMLVCAPLWTGRSDALGVVLHITDVQHLAGQAPLDIERSESQPGNPRLTIPSLGATGEGPNIALALAALTATARRRSQALLNDPLTPSDTRAIALRVWIADALQQLPELLGEHMPAA